MCVCVYVYVCVCVCVCVSFSAVSQIGCWDIAIQWIFSKHIAKYVYMFNVLLLNNEHFDQKFYHILFFDIFLNK